MRESEERRSLLTSWSIPYLAAVSVCAPVMSVVLRPLTEVWHVYALYGAFTAFAVMVMVLGRGTKRSAFALALPPAAIAASLWIGYLQWHETTYMRERARGASCQANLKQIGMALGQYCQDYDGYLPPASSWNSSLKRYVHNDAILRCPNERNKTLCSYAINASVAGLRLKDIRSTDRTPLCFESEPGWNMSGGPAQLARPPRHTDGSMILFADGHMKWVKHPQNLTWTP